MLKKGKTVLNHEDLANKRNRVAKHLEGKNFKPMKASDIDPTKSKGRVEINRDILLQDMLKLISVVPMDGAFKEILRIKLTYPDYAVELFMNLGVKYGIRLQTIYEMEEFAKEKIIEYLKKNSLQDAINAFNADKNKDVVEIKNKMASEKTIITDGT